MCTPKFDYRFAFLSIGNLKLTFLIHLSNHWYTLANPENLTLNCKLSAHLRYTAPGCELFTFITW